MSKEVGNIDRKVYRLSKFFDALSNAVRLQILFDLADGEKYVTEIADRLDRSTGSISRQLKILRDNSLVKSETKDQCRYYRVSRPKLIGAVKKIYNLLTREE